MHDRVNLFAYRDRTNNFIDRLLRGSISLRGNNRAASLPLRRSCPVADNIRDGDELSDNSASKRSWERPIERTRPDARKNRLPFQSDFADSTRNRPSLGRVKSASAELHTARTDECWRTNEPLMVNKWTSKRACIAPARGT